MRSATAVAACRDGPTEWGRTGVYALRMSVLTLLQALDKEKLAALLGAADVSNPAVLSVAAFIAKNVVQGNRAAQEWLLDWSDVEVAVREGRVVGLTTEVGQTKEFLSPLLSFLARRGCRGHFSCPSHPVWSTLL